MWSFAIFCVYLLLALTLYLETLVDDLGCFPLDLCSFKNIVGLIIFNKLLFLVWLRASNPSRWPPHKIRVLYRQLLLYNGHTNICFAEYQLSKFVRPFTPNIISSKVFATTTGSALHAPCDDAIQLGQCYIT